MKPEQISIFSVLEEKQQAEKPYFNGMGEPLPWESEYIKAHGNAGTIGSKERRGGV